MDIYLMRHPAREGEEGRCLGQTDVPWSQAGRESLPRLIQKAVALKLQRIISSDLRRCSGLAREIGMQANLRVEVDAVWRELNFGLWENRSWTELRQEDPERVEAWFRDFVEVIPPEGESFRQLQERTVTALHSFNNSSSQRVLIVTHAGVIRALLCALCPLPLSRAFAFTVPYGGIAHLQRQEQKWSLVPDGEIILPGTERNVG